MQSMVSGGTGMSRLSVWAIYHQLCHILSTDRLDIPDTVGEFVLRENRTRMTRIGRIFVVICRITREREGRVFSINRIFWGKKPRCLCYQWL